MESGSLLGGSTSSIGSSLSEDIERHLNSIGLGTVPSHAASSDVLNDSLGIDPSFSKTILRRCSSECTQEHSHTFSPNPQGSPKFANLSTRDSFNKGKEEKKNLSSLRVEGGITRNTQRRSFSSLLRRTESSGKSAPGRHSMKKWRDRCCSLSDVDFLLVFPIHHSVFNCKSSQSMPHLSKIAIVKY